MKSISKMLLAGVSLIASSAVYAQAAPVTPSGDDAAASNPATTTNPAAMPTRLRPGASVIRVTAPVAKISPDMPQAAIPNVGGLHSVCCMAS